ncbi:helix-turn-helix domain-containing protein [Endozoicomonas elysicola]|uniref:HTH cro/C1-type domain-containing protein n=1 Tax=Endozoicomonas elysicola TaxID=305900 RepID=A0A081KDD2_9GAMM|nr:helix-turn-helix transcriptional regulator [Endozoicomonas elysicola]KEI72158.1 hypothetical protein GV64_16770 [Endozoicomonas elysicola]
MNFNLIEYVLKNNKINQKELAEKLDVSRAQISKWKSGDSIPHDREQELIKLAGLFGFDPEWAAFVKTEDNGNDWLEYIRFMNDCSLGRSKAWQFDESPEIYFPSVLLMLAKFSCSIPDKAPCANELKNEDYEYTKFDELIIDFLESYGPLSEWCSLYLAFDNDELFEFQGELEACAVDLALSYVKEELLHENGLNISTLEQHFLSSKKYIRKTLSLMCRKMNKLKVPFERDYFEYINEHPFTIEDFLIESSISKKSVESFFTYHEKLVLHETRRQSELLEELHVKIDSLLSEGDKEYFSSVLENCPPSANKHQR